MNQAKKWIFAVLLSLVSTIASALYDVPITANIVRQSSDVVLENIPLEAFEGATMTSLSVVRIDLFGGTSMYAFNQYGNFYFHPDTFGTNGAYVLPDNFAGFGFGIEAVIGKPDIEFRLLWRNVEEFGLLAFVGQNASADVVFLAPEYLGDPFGLRVTLACTTAPCSARITPYFATAPVPEPATWATMFVGVGLVIFVVLRRRSHDLRKALI